MQHTRDDDGRRRKTTAQNGRMVWVDGRFVPLGHARPVVAKSALLYQVTSGSALTTAVRQTLAAAWQGMKLCKGLNVAFLALAVVADPVADKIIAWILLIFLLTAIGGLIGIWKDGE